MHAVITQYRSIVLPVKPGPETGRGDRASAPEVSGVVLFACNVDDIIQAVITLLDGVARMIRFELGVTRRRVLRIFQVSDSLCYLLIQEMVVVVGLPFFNFYSTTVS